MLRAWKYRMLPMTKLVLPPISSAPMSGQRRNSGAWGRSSRAPVRPITIQAMTPSGTSRSSDPRAGSIVGAAIRRVTLTTV
jgi:hypothetical protein